MELDDRIKRLRNETKAKREMQDMITEMFKPVFESHPSGKVLLASTKLERKIQDISEPNQYFDDESKAEKVLLFLEQLNALVDQFMKDYEVENDGV